MNRTFRAVAALALLAACAPAHRPGPSPEEGPVTRTRGDALPPIPLRRGPLAIDVVYPAEGGALTVTDSTFVYGSVGTGEASLRINGAPVTVAPNGAFLAYLPVPQDGVYRVEASAGGQTATLTRRVRLPAGETGALSVAPRGMMAVPAGERVEVRVRGPRGGQARLLLPDGSSVPLVEVSALERPEGFLRDRAAPREVAGYAGSFPARVPLLAPGAGTPALGDARGAGAARVEVVVGRDTLRAPLALSLGVMEPDAPRVGVAASPRPDAAVIARALPGSGTPYQWSFPNGTRFTITGQQDSAYRVRLTDDLSLWVDARDVRLLPAGAPAPQGTVGTVRLEGREEWTDLRLATSDRLPFRVTAAGSWLMVEVYGARTRTNWLQYGPRDPFVLHADWDQPRSDLYVVRVNLAHPAWGWQASWDEAGNLLVRIRRPPAIDREHPLRGMYIAVDAGHPPGGATGPTRLAEADANQAIAKRLVRLLNEAGARVLETRPGSAPVDLAARPRMATEAGVHLLVSVHNNAFPDGVNPFTNNGTTTFYNAPQSEGLARHLQNELVRELRLRDLGIARADLALVRPTWMPSSLTETMFLMIPEQENALRDPAVQERIARAHLRGIEAFFRDHAGQR
jgi:N-acetylmuramoyl-L-alanine amidase